MKEAISSSIRISNLKNYIALLGSILNVKVGMLLILFLASLGRTFFIYG